MIKKVGLWLALAALLVNGPRFVIIFLKADSIDLPKATEAALLTATGIATGLVLTGGGAFIAHSLAESKVRGPMQWFMILCWFLLLIFSVLLLAPLMVAAIAESPLNTVLDSRFSQWLWSITSVLAVEVIAAGAMVAYAVHGRADDDYQNDNGSPTVFSILSGALVKRLETTIAPSPTVAAVGNDDIGRSSVSKAIDSRDSLLPIDSEAHPLATNKIEVDNPDGELSGSDSKRQYSKSERQALLLNMLNSLNQDDGIRVDELADRLACSTQTIYRDIAELKKDTSIQIDEGKVTMSETGN